ncbi:MAG: sulfide/dihydroorotate dehydrogenase-like FAD/NAD-binding protein, partial [Spirochaetota bacterium]
MHTILEKRQFSDEVFYLRVNAPEISRARRAGQFVLVQIDIDYGERIPLTIADANAEEGWIALVFQAVGATTHRLAMKNAGDKIEAILGPLGRPTHISKVGTVV